MRRQCLLTKPVIDMVTVLLLREPSRQLCFPHARKNSFPGLREKSGRSLPEKRPVEAFDGRESFPHSTCPRYAAPPGSGKYGVRSRAARQNRETFSTNNR